ncbi:calcium-binding protein [Leptolyngbya sp. FACHB-541]|uniref:beta strand repeat-containing protein n=1 Tax=Leptolyngbya sp. FACHB-541 TaxID=2692810 RepID=UPI00199A9D5B|nr:calcium-binding protein [Leptolyngbya sp. FACHB-541]MBD1997994.1 calcium-binding protein [Leptolyngbya sp. FACHB-541]
MATINGNSRSNSLRGTNSADSVFGLAGNDVLFGLDGNDLLDGGDGSDTLDGGTGTNTLRGGAGNDIYVVDSASDRITEGSNQGIDTVQASASWVLGSNLENLTLTGRAIRGTGNTLNNRITGNTSNNVLDGGAGNDIVIGGAGNDSLIGNSGNDILQGDAGNDTLNGGIGIDAMRGGVGNDLYFIDNVRDTAIEGANAGTDTVNATVSFTLGSNVENLTLTGSAAISGTGNSLNNTIIGNGGSNILTGGLGDDSLRGAAGNDILQGGDGNDFLDGGIGDDSMAGGAGNDTYLVDNLNDTVNETPGGGVDRVISSIDFVLGDEVENLILTGTTNLNGIGNALNNTIIGNSGANTLEGGAGNDYLNGGEGTDTLAGDDGDDTYVIDNEGDIVTENTDGGDDTVISALRAYTLADNIENLVLGGTDGIEGTGNDLNNRITGNSGDNSLSGGGGDDILTGNAGDDTLDGGDGTDTLIGGAGNDLYIVNDTSDTIVEAVGGGIDTVVSIDTFTLSNNLENLVLNGEADINGTGDAAANSIVGNSGNNILTGGAGNDTLEGGAGNDTLEGGVGNDIMRGGAGDDIYTIDGIGDTVVENAEEGTDLVNSSVSFTLGANLENLTLTGNANINGTGNALGNSITGNNGNNTLNGGAGNDVLDGGVGSDTMLGGIGNDVYFFDAVGDRAIENINEGTDTVFATSAANGTTFTLSGNLENLTLGGTANLNGTGNDLANTITGNDGSNTISGLAGNDVLSGGAGDDTLLGGLGNDLLDGGVGNDTMTGGAGNDTYIVDASTDVVTELAGEGTDTILAGSTFTLVANIENLTLEGTGNFNGTGNDLNNTIIGNSGNNILDGGLGADALRGGLGNDTYVVDNAGDVVSENVNEGTDTVNASVNFTLSAGLENLTLTSTGNINGTGNESVNTIIGNSGNNTLGGGGQDDVLVGGAGNDILDGGVGNDSMVGGIGDDTYFIDAAGDVVTEATSEGIDIINSSIGFALAANFENLTLTGSANVNGTGNDVANTITGNNGNNTLNGLGGNDTLFGNGGNDTLDGGAGNDVMSGGAGDDTYIVDSINDLVSENSNEGLDTVRSNVNYTLGNNLENLTLTGSGNLNGTGNAGANTITGTDGDNILDGGAGTDLLIGGLGNDTYIVDNVGDRIQEVSGVGIDAVESSVSFNLATNGEFVENLFLTGSDNIDGIGNALNNTIMGNSGNNRLDGGTGADSLNGGTGNDTYIVDNAGDRVTELLDAGIDFVESSVSFALGSNLENLTLTGTDNINGTGNALNNTIIGNSGNNRIDGSTGADEMTGGLGNDTYVVDNLGDTIIEASNAGIETVESSVTFVLGTELENLTLTGALDINGTGNAGNNTIRGNSSNNRIDGGAGADIMSGGAGNDIFIVDNVGDTVTELLNEGIDLVQSSITFTLGDSVENLTLTGTENINGTGNSGVNTIIGNSGNNRLDGGAGADELVGGDGNDTYVVDNVGERIIEIGTGLDTVESSVTLTLGDNLENLTLTGTSNIDGTGNELGNTIRGNAGNNILRGEAGNDVLEGGIGSDVLDGGTGADLLSGGDGNDLYITDNEGDVINEVGTGIDTVRSSITSTLASNLENLELIGVGNIDGIGNTGDNTIIGNGANNILSGLAGNDTLEGGAGNDILNGGAGIDVMRGGLGDDIYGIDNLSDTVFEDADAGIDRVESSVNFTLGANFENLTLTGTATNGTGNALRNTIIGNGSNNRLDGGAGADVMSGGAGSDTYVVDDISDTVIEAENAGIDAVESSVNFTLSENVENLTLTGTGNINGTGNGLANTIVGNSGNNRIDGGAGVDNLSGGLGADIYVVDNAGDIIIELSNAGNDTVESNITYTLGANLENLTLVAGAGDINGIGNAENNTIRGNESSNRLDGSAGIDELIGGDGDDTYVVDNLGDRVIETGTGIDTVEASVTYILGNNLENLTLTGTANIDGTGNALNNTISGNSGNNRINGGVGADVMRGGNGNDTYVVDTVADTVVEELNAGIDTVESSVSFTLSNNVENLVLLTGAGNINGTGNGSVNTITGNEGDNRLDGGVGADELIGGAGNDTYVVDNAGDRITETTGIDTVEASITYTLATNLENLTLTGSTNIDGIGNAEANTILGNSGNNRLEGRVGNDILDGGEGADTLVGGVGDDTYFVDNSGDIVTENAGEGVDTIFSRASYTLGAGTSVENLFLTGTENIDGRGNEFTNTITGNAGNNILDGRAGADLLSGGAGNDTYFVDNTGDVVSETIGGAQGGIDTIVSSISFDLSNASGANIENLTLAIGAGNINGTGNAENNTITGNEGNNILNGGAGVDHLRGGAGDDTYIIDDLSDTVFEEANQGIDTVRSSVSISLSDNVENLILTAGAGNIAGNGNALNNTIVGNEGNNVLGGGAGDDFIDGGTGADTMSGGEGDDTYIVDNLGDTVTEAGDGLDLVRSSVNFALGGNIENLTLTAGAGDINGTGNELANTITGNTGNNRLDGGAGADRLTGGAGNDLYIVDNGGDVVVELEAQGTDQVNSSVTYTLGNFVENLTLTGSASINGTGNALANTIIGNSGDNILDGRAGADEMSGGLGNDTYFIDDAGDRVVELPGGGIDTVVAGFTFVLGDDVENLTLTGEDNIDGTGNALRNTIIGNAGNNRLDGGAGNDVLMGGAGNDTYYVDSLLDQVDEMGGSGADLVISKVTFTLGAGVENLTLASGAGNINGTGNGLANRIIGNQGDNILTGGDGADILEGGGGNDTYIVDDLDTIFEATDGGLDTVQSTFNFTLSDNLENLSLTGDALIGTGNNSSNTITGNGGNNTLSGLGGNDDISGSEGNDLLFGGAGNDILNGDNGDDILNGGAGNDVLKGGTGIDRFVYDTGSVFATGDVGSDRIEGFQSNTDKIVLDKTTFSLQSGPGLAFSQESDFAIVETDAGAGSANIVYSLGTGNLFYTGVQFAQLTTNTGSIPSITANDFEIRA